MRLTKAKAIELSIGLWEWLAETGRYKDGWPGWDIHGRVFNDCFLCEYTRNVHTCKPCPYDRKFGNCLDGVYATWDSAPTPKGRKLYARRFLAELRQLKAKK